MVIILPLINHLSLISMAQNLGRRLFATSQFIINSSPSIVFNRFGIYYFPACINNFINKYVRFTGCQGHEGCNPPINTTGIECAASRVLGTSTFGDLHHCVQNPVLMLLSKHWQKPESRGFYLKLCYKSHFSWCRAGLCTACIHAVPYPCISCLFSNSCSHPVLTGLPDVTNPGKIWSNILPL